MGDALDLWRVEAYEPDRLLRLRAEMKVSGHAWLELEVTPDTAPDDGEGDSDDAQAPCPGATIRQTALFDPVGLPGHAYGYLVYPLHALVFRAMLRGLTRAAQREAASIRQASTLAPAAETGERADSSCSATTSNAMPDPAAAKVNLAEKLAAVREPWVPKLVAELNGQHVRLARLEGAFDWHAHAAEDELFLVLEGRLELHLRDGIVPLEPGELYVVPRGVEHRPVAPDGAAVLLFEPASTRNTGAAVTARTIEPTDLERI